jgi:dihydroorotate dehydrogenase (fumarate)
VDLTTNYLGLRLKNPLVAGASPLSRVVSSVRMLEDAGIAAVVVYSLFEEQIEHDRQAHDHFEQLGTESYAEATSYLPALDYVPRGPDGYVEHLGHVKQAVDIPVIASLNGTTRGGWIDYAKMFEQAGADAVELNIYDIAADPDRSALDVESRYVEILRAVKETVSIPVALKLSPFFSSLAHFAKRVDECGVDGLVLFNRFYQPDIDLEELEVTPDLVLSAPHELRLPLRWIAILDPLIDASLAASTGVYAAPDVLKLLLAGADVAMLCAVLLRDGPAAVGDLLSGMTDWMTEHEYTGLQQLRGSMNHSSCSNPAGFERANYMQALHTYS